MLRLSVVALALAILPVPALAEDDNPLIDYAGFAALTRELADTREARRLPLAEFLARARHGEAILLDARSESAFRAGHIEGAINLPFTDFTADRLRETLGPPGERAIYIYCNNNFVDDVAPVPTKKAELALNIPTFINLHGYGYTNVWELADATSLSAVPWAGD